jgi:hypothetical protein
MKARPSTGSPPRLERWLRRPRERRTARAASRRPSRRRERRGPRPRRADR